MMYSLISGSGVFGLMIYMFTLVFFCIVITKFADWMSIRNVKAPVKEIVKAIKSGSDFVTVRTPIYTERDSEVKVVAIIEFAGKKTKLLNLRSFGYRLKGDLDWMSSDEVRYLSSAVVKVLDAREDARLKKESEKKATDDSKRRKKAEDFIKNGKS